MKARDRVKVIPIDGGRPFVIEDALFDSGADASILSKRAAERAGIPLDSFGARKLGTASTRGKLDIVCCVAVQLEARGIQSRPIFIDVADGPREDLIIGHVEMDRPDFTVILSPQRPKVVDVTRRQAVVVTLGPSHDQALSNPPRKGGLHDLLTEDNPPEETEMTKTAENPAKKTETSQATAPAAATTPAAPQPAAPPSAPVASAPPAAADATSANPPAPVNTPPQDSAAQAGGTAPEQGAAPNPPPVAGKDCDLDPKAIQAATSAAVVAPLLAEAMKAPETTPNPPAAPEARPEEKPSQAAPEANPPAPAEKKADWKQTERNGKKKVHRKKKSAKASAAFLRGKGLRARVEPVSGGWGVFVDGPAAAPGPKPRKNPIHAVSVINGLTCPKDGSKLQRTPQVIENSPKRPELRGKHVYRCGKCNSSFSMK